MKMRELFDKANGEGTWDRMHDSGIFMDVPIKVGETMVSVFPGSNREVTVETVRLEIRKALIQINHIEGLEDEELDDD